MHRYAITTRPAVSFAVWPAPLTAEALGTQVAGAVVRSVVAYPNGSHDIDIRLRRPSHEQALNEIAHALEQFGLDLAQAYVIEVATSAIAGAILGGTGGAACGAAVEDGAAGILLTLFCTALGAVVGSFRERVVATYAAHRAHPWAPWMLYLCTPVQGTASPAW